MNKVEIRCFYDGSKYVHVKNSMGKVIAAVEFISDAQVKEICRDCNAYVDIDERENSEYYEYLDLRDNIEDTVKDFPHMSARIMHSAYFSDVEFDKFADIFNELK